MSGLEVPSRLYRLYWAGRYLERIDLTSRSLIAALRYSRGRPEALDSALRELALALGTEYRGPREFLESVLYGEDAPGSLLRAARMLRMNMMGLGVERLVRESNMLVLAAENRVPLDDPNRIIRHLEDLLDAALRLGRVIEEELTAPPTPPARVLREQLLHQQQ